MGSRHKRRDSPVAAGEHAEYRTGWPAGRLPCFIIGWCQSACAFHDVKAAFRVAEPTYQRGAQPMSNRD